MPIKRGDRQVQRSFLRYSDGKVRLGKLRLVDAVGCAKYETRTDHEPRRKEDEDLLRAPFVPDLGRRVIA